MKFISRNGLKWILIIFCLSFFGIPTGLAARDTLPDFLNPGQNEEPLEFRTIEVTDRTEHSLTIRWKTNNPARGKIRFGRGNSVKKDLRPAFRRSHSISFDSLEEGTRYRFQIFAWDNSNHRIKSQVVVAKTRGTPPPRFRKITVRNRTMYGGTVHWVTNVPTRATFRAGHDTSVKFLTTHDSPTRYHGVELTRFYPDQQLHYRITIRDTRGHTQKSSVKSFRTREANFALNKPVEGTFDRPIYGVRGDTGSTPYLQRINDGNYSYAKGTANSGNPSDTHQYFVINLREIIKPGRAVFYWRNLAFPKRYEIYGSRFKRNWQKLAGNLNASNGKHKLTPIGNMRAWKQTVRFSDTAPEIQFVKVKIPKDSPYYGKYPSYQFVQLFEFKIFPASVSSPDNQSDTNIKGLRMLSTKRFSPIESPGVRGSSDTSNRSTRRKYLLRSTSTGKPLRGGE